YNPFQITNLQLYNPIYKLFFELNENNIQRISLNHPLHMETLTTVFDVKSAKPLEKPVFIKYSPLLNPVRYMIGKYSDNSEKITRLPALNSRDIDILPSITSYNNTSYVDCFFSFLTSVLLNHHGFLHGVDYYGSYLGIQKQFKTCITDDLDYLRNSDYFHEHVGKDFYIETPTEMSDDIYNGAGSRGNKQKLEILETGQDILMEDAIDLNILEPILDSDIIQEDLEEVYENPAFNAENSDNDDDDSSNSHLNYSSEGEVDPDDVNDSDTESENGSENWQTEDGSSTEEEDEVYGYIHNFPVQMICLEKCEGTLDELFEKNEIDDKTGAAALFQVIMMLLAYQKAFKFTHNDLHTNNIMWVSTDVEYLSYRFSGKVYRVPTYGKIFKLIDFGRAIYRFQDKQFCSDSFAPGGDAATQYNFEPFLNKNKPRLDPNFSFDLCRLGSSIFDFLMDENTPVSKMDELQKTIHRWCLDDNKKNVLYKKNGEERYPNFKLYKMIARTVHEHTPEAQL
ncbi:MAG: hypothetical protein EBU93_06195, partial [Chlamydiae bacterium]|nr:hypothetical protein [Chlamydiota bacterium]